MAPQGLLEPYQRIHVLPRPRSLREAARFIASSLLLSHSIRRDTAAVVILRGWTLVAGGDRVRQLRPDEETSTGWLRAVLRGRHGGLGAVLLGGRPASLPRRALLVETWSARPSPPPPPPPRPPAVLVYWPAGSTPGLGEAWARCPGGPAWCAAALNIHLDGAPLI